MNESLKKIFDAWRCGDLHKNHAFVKDGAIYPEKWEEANVKVLFLLKESVYEKFDAEKNDWDVSESYRQFIEGKKDEFSRPNMVYRLGEWTYGLSAVFKSRQVPIFCDDPENTAHVDALRHSAIVNIKKSNGKYPSDNLDLEKYVSEDIDLILDEIKILKSHIVVCGGTWGLISEKLHSKTKIEKLGDSTYLVNGSVWIDYYHPAYHTYKRASFYEICSLLKNGLNEKQLME